MKHGAILVTGAAGEIGEALLQQLAKDNDKAILALDLRPLSDFPRSSVTFVQGDVTNEEALAKLFAQYDIDTVFHLAALLSTRAELSPTRAHHVNVEGTLGLLRLAADRSEERGKPVKFIFPSSIAVYGLPDVQTKAMEGKVREEEWTCPRTMYGCNKLYCEQLGNYFSRHYQQAAKTTPTRIDFRSLRLPGLISPFTVPSGGTSDYAPEMLHAAAQGHSYECFVAEETRIPFMVMPDAIKALLSLARAPKKDLGWSVYNVSGFSLSAGELRKHILQAFDGAQIRFRPDVWRQSIVDSWPTDVDDSHARDDWNWQPDYDANKAFVEYLLPNIVGQEQTE